MTESDASSTLQSTHSSSNIFTHSDDPNRSSSLSPVRAAPTPPFSPQHTTSSPTYKDHTQHISFVTILNGTMPGEANAMKELARKIETRAVSKSLIVLCFGG